MLSYKEPQLFTGIQNEQTRSSFRGNDKFMLKKKISNSFLRSSTLKKNHTNTLNHSKTLRMKGVLAELFAYPISTV